MNGVRGSDGKKLAVGGDGKLPDLLADRSLEQLGGKC